MNRPDKPARTVKRARQLRSQVSLPEALLWRELKASANGLRFRRQHPAGPYILDFFCARVNLAIEIDGIGHDMGDRPERDTARDTWLAQRRIDTLRIPARDVLKDPSSVAERVIRIALDRLERFSKAPPSGLRPASCGPRATPSAPPSQVDGEGLRGDGETQ